LEGRDGNPASQSVLSSPGSCAKRSFSYVLNIAPVL
jgi:hypothetical protein